MVDLETCKIIVNKGGIDNNPLTYVKKVNYPIYGESLLTACWDKNINLWSHEMLQLY